MPPIAFYLPSSFIEWPGRITASVVLQGCNFRCPFCHSSEFVPMGAPRQEISSEELLEELSQRSGWIDGVVISGGEPTLHADLPELLRSIKDLGLLVKLDTNGSNPVMLQRLIGEALVDLAAMDIKAPLDERYHMAAGKEVNLGKVRRSIDILRQHPETAEFRTTVVPGMHDEATVEEIARLIAGARIYYIQNFEPRKTLDPSMQALEPLKEEELASMARTAAGFVKCTVVRGTEIAEGDGCRTLKKAGVI